MAPNFLSGSVTLEKSLFERLLSPINFIFFVDLINKPNINLPSVPEFLAFITKPFLYVKLFRPFPNISQYFFLISTFIPNFFIASKAATTSSDINKL